MATVNSLVTKWGFQIDTKPLEQMKASVASAKSAIQSLAIEASVAAIALFKTAETTAKLGKEALLSSQRTGLGVESFQELSFAAKRAGVDSEGFTHAMAHLNRSVFEAKTGNKETIRSFMQLGGGVAQAAIRGASTQEMFYKIADRIKGIQDPAAKTALAMKLFGRAGFQMLPVLNQGADGLKRLGEEAEEMGLILSGDAAQSSKEFMESLEDVESLFLGIKRTVGVALLKPFTEVFKAFAQWIRLNREVIKQNITGFFKSLAVVIKITMSVISALVSRLSELLNPLGGIGSALSAVAVAFAVFKSIQVLGALGNIASLAFNLSDIFRGLAASVMGLARGGAMAAIWPVLMGIAIIALIGVIEDLFGYFQGKDSVTGRLIEGIKALDPYFQKFGFWGRLITTALLTPLRGIVDVVRTLGGVIGSIAGGGGMSGAFDAAKEGLSDFANPFGKVISGKGFNLTSSLGFGDTAPKTNDQSLSSGKANQNNIQTSVTVNVPPGTDPNLVGDRVQDGVSKSLDNILRPAHRALIPGVSY